MTGIRTNCEDLYNNVTNIEVTDQLGDEYEHPNIDHGYHKPAGVTDKNSLRTVPDTGDAVF